MKYPLSCLDGTAADAFRAVLGLHLNGTRRVLDPTYGEGLSWRGIATDGGLFDDKVTLVRGDGDLFDMVVRHPEWADWFDLVYYDPPYLVDVKTSNDPRAEAYGGYQHARHELEQYMSWLAYANICLRPGGKVIVKCGDQYHVPTRRLLMHHLRWCEYIQRYFAIVDFYVYRFHRVSPTAYQVKDRPSAVITHSYFIVGQKQCTD